MNGRSSAVPEWHESKIAVSRTPGRSGLTLIYNLEKYYLSWVHVYIHYIVHVIVHDMTCSFVVDWINYVVES